MAPGSKARARRGFTLIELLVVLALVAIATATVSLALRDPAQAQLEREGERLITLLETARAEARAAGLAVRWQPGADAEGRHFRFIGLPDKLGLPVHWLGDPPAVQFEGNARALVLGPEPLLPAQAVTLRLGAHRLRIHTDGLAPFGAEAQRVEGS